MTAPTATLIRAFRWMDQTVRERVEDMLVGLKTASDVRDLSLLIEDESEDWVADSAARILGRQGDSSLLPRVSKGHHAPRESLPTSSWHQSYFLALPAEITTPIAREWVDEPGWQTSLGLAVLAREADAVDHPRIVKLLRRYLDNPNGYYFDALKALESYSDPMVSPLVERAYVMAERSAVRGPALNVLARIAPTSEHIPESLWDSHEIMRCRAARFSVKDTRVLARLKELAHDPFEDEFVRGVAAERLAEDSG